MCQIFVSNFTGGLRLHSESHPINVRALDVLRGLLALVVLFGHARWLLWAGHFEWAQQPHAMWEVPLAYASAVFRYGREAVLVFFALSGFFIHLRAAQQAGAGNPIKMDARSYYKRRTHRLLAPYCLALVVTVAFDSLGRWWFPTLYLAQTGVCSIDPVFAAKGYPVQSVIPALAFLPSSLGPDFGTNGPLWSLAYEVVYYAIYPLWILVRRWRLWAAYVLIPAGCLGLTFYSSDIFPVAVVRHYFLWLAGAALAELAARWRLRRNHGSLYGGAFLAGFGAYVALTNPTLRLLAAVIYSSSAVLVFASFNQRFSNLAIVRAIEALGVRSYTIYIVHFPVLAFLSAGIIDHYSRRPLHGWYALAGALVALFFALGCFHICERHFLHLRLRLPPAVTVGDS